MLAYIHFYLPCVSTSYIGYYKNELSGYFLGDVIIIGNHSLPILYGHFKKNNRNISLTLARKWDILWYLVVSIGKIDKELLKTLITLEWQVEKSVTLSHTSKQLCFRNGANSLFKKFSKTKVHWWQSHHNKLVY